MQSPKLALPIFGIAHVAHRHPFCILAQSGHLRPSELHPHKQTKQMFSGVWSNICCLWSCPSSGLSRNSNCEAWWHQQTTSHVPKALPNRNNLCAKVQQVPESLHRCPRACCDVPSAAERGSPNSATSLSSGMAHQTIQPAAHVECPKYILQLGSMWPRGLC